MIDSHGHAVALSRDMIWEPEFAGDLFDALARRHHISSDTISKAELLEFWDQISDTSFDGRLQTFFDMYVAASICSQ